MLDLIASVDRFFAKAISPGRLLPIQFDITNSCNLECRHCYHSHHKNDGALKLKDWLGILDQYEALTDRIGYRRCLFICGGEPLTSPYLKSLLSDVSKRRGYRVGILTNGTLLHRLQREWIQDIPQLNVQVSLDAPNEKDHDDIRGVGNFNRALDGINHLKQLGVSVDLLAVLSVNNSHQIGAFFDLASKVGARSMNFTRLIVQGYAKNLVAIGEDAPLDPLQLKRALRQVVIESARSGIWTNLSGPLFRLLGPDFGARGYFDEGLVVDHKGNLLASSRSRLVLGHAIRDGLQKVFFEHPVYKSIRAGKIDVCGTCRYFSSCGGDRNAAYAATGDYLGADPGCWLTKNNKEEDVNHVE